MNWEALANATNVAVVAVFGEAVTYTPAATGVPETLQAPFDRAHERLEFAGELQTVVTRPVLDLKLDLLSVAPAVGDLFSVRGVAYQVREVQKNGHGAVKLIAHEV